MSISTSLKEMVSQYCYRIEMHAHSYPASSCAKMTGEELIEELHAHGYHGVVLTNHYIPVPLTEEWVKDFLDAFEEAKAAAQKYGMTVYYGMEMTFWDAPSECLIYGDMDEELLRVMAEEENPTFASVYQKLRSPDRLFIQAHPFRDYGTDDPQVPLSPEMIDGIEAYNMSITANNCVHLAVEYANRHQIPIITSGSDLHAKDQVGATAILTKTMPKTTRELVAILRSRDYLLEISGKPLIPYDFL